jgi:hypothetical protein
MKTYTIENETNNITVHATKQEAEAVAGSECFANEATLAKLAANWPTARLVEIWNSLPGETQVKKFKDRATAVSRIWKAIQRLGQMSADALDDADWNRAKEGPASKGPEPAPTPQPSTTPPLSHKRPRSRPRRLRRRPGLRGRRRRPWPPPRPRERAKAARSAALSRCSNAKAA